MTNQLIERLAREAGFDTDERGEISFEGYLATEEVRRFAALVAEQCSRDVRRAASAEHAGMLIRAAFPMPKD